MVLNVDFFFFLRGGSQTHQDKGVHTFIYGFNENGTDMGETASLDRFAIPNSEGVRAGNGHTKRELGNLKG